ncbi:MAG: hypothetical protein LC802_04160 [Acidobacteria bacterium]|nr:hypothetical protein [Acidobacteriota bacterium]
MFESNTKKLALKCLALVLLISGLILFSNDSTKSLFASSRIQQDRAQLPAVSIEPQDSTPLRIVSATPLFLDSETYTVRVILQNQSSKKVRAFAIAADNTSGGNGGLVMFVNLARSNAVLVPTQMRSVDINYSQKGSPTNVTLSMDFVELSDGSTWGPDVNKSQDRLSGQRAGAKIEGRRIRELLKAKGVAAVLASISGETSGDNVASSTSEHSSVWQDGFRSGVGSVRYRIRQALQTGDSTQLEQEVTRPFDTSEGEPQ